MLPCQRPVLAPVWLLLKDCYPPWFWTIESLITVLDFCIWNELFVENACLLIYAPGDGGSKKFAGLLLEVLGVLASQRRIQLFLAIWLLINSNIRCQGKWCNFFILSLSHIHTNISKTTFDLLVLFFSVSPYLCFGVVLFFREKLFLLRIVLSLTQLNMIWPWNGAYFKKDQTSHGKSCIRSQTD